MCVTWESERSRLRGITKASKWIVVVEVGRLTDGASAQREHILVNGGQWMRRTRLWAAFAASWHRDSTMGILYSSSKKKIWHRQISGKHQDVGRDKLVKWYGRVQP